jgi:putative transposase
LLSQRQIRRGSFVSAKDLIAKIETFVDAYNARSTPFVWTATSDAILEKVGKICKAINGTRNKLEAAAQPKQLEYRRAP